MCSRFYKSITLKVCIDYFVINQYCIILYIHNDHYHAFSNLAEKYKKKIVKGQEVNIVFI